MRTLVVYFDLSILCSDDPILNIDDTVLDSNEPVFESELTVLTGNFLAFFVILSLKQSCIFPLGVDSGLVSSS